MKTLVLCLVCFVGMAAATSVTQFDAVTPSGSGHGGPGTDDELFNQEYAFAYLVNGYRHGFMCDDFEVTSDASLEEVIVWVIYANGMPTETNLAILEDSGLIDPNFATNVWNGTFPATNVDTGDDNWGYDIWETTLDLSSSPASLTGGTLYWLSYEFHDDTIYDYWLVQDPVWGDYAWTGSDGVLWTRVDDPSTFDYAADAFFILNGTPQALDNATWGEIKNVF